VVSPVGFEVFTAVTMGIAVSWDVAPCEFNTNRRFVGTYCLHFQGRRNNPSQESVRRILADLLLFHSESLEHSEKLAAAEHSFNSGHGFLSQNTSILATKTRYMDRIVRVATDTESHRNKMVSVSASHGRLSS
jgi:hypothetical protein